MAALDLLMAPALTFALLALHGAHTSAPTGWLLSPSACVAASFWLSRHARFRENTDRTLSRARTILFFGLLVTPLAAALGPMLVHEWALTVVFVWGSLHALTVARYTLTTLRPSQGVRTDKLLGKGGAVRTATAAAFATGVDFALFTSLLWATGLSAPVATFLGAVTGGIINFTLNRNWTFNASGTNLKMARRYIGVSATSALLNASFVAMLLWVPGQLPVFAWLIARGLVFLAWNYPLHRDYVFEHLGPRARVH